MNTTRGRFLLVDTSDRVAIIGIYEGAKTLWESRTLEGRPNLEWVDRSITEAQRSCGLHLRDLDAIACGIGPGGFTSLRIGMSLVKAMGQALDKPVICVNRLEAAAMGYHRTTEGKPRKRQSYLVRLHAARDLEYVAVYSITDGCAPQCMRKPVAISVHKADLIRVASTVRTVVIQPDIFFAGIPAVAALKLAAGETSSALSVLPMYLRPPTIGPRASRVDIARKRRLR